jgi:arabinofuranosyltransferase
VEGRRLGDLLNELHDPQAPDVGVLPAGGIAVTYQGRVVDLLGLNWAEMAHASSRRTGMPGHSAFNLDVFWKHPPQLMLPQMAGPASPVNEKQTPANFELWVLHGLMNEPRFREEYRPVLLHLGNGDLFAYARTGFIDRHPNDPRIESLTWERFRQASGTVASEPN